MSEINEEAIRQRIAQITKERDNYIQNANRQIAAYDGAIQALRSLLPQDSPENEEEE